MFPLSPTTLIYIAVALAVAAAMAGVYHAGGAAPRAELERLVDKIRADTALHEAEDRRKDQASTHLVDTLETEHAHEIAKNDADWDAYLAERLRLANNAVAAKRAQPAPTVARITGDPDKDLGLSHAIEAYRLSARGSLALCEIAARQSGIAFGRQLEGAQRESATLAECTAYISGIRNINSDSPEVKQPATAKDAGHDKSKEIPNAAVKTQ